MYDRIVGDIGSNQHLKKPAQVKFGGANQHEQLSQMNLSQMRYEDLRLIL